MDKKLQQLKKEYQATPIPIELDLVVNNALKQKKTSGFRYKWIAGAAAAAAIFVAGVNSSPTVANAFANVPVLGDLVKVITFKEFKLSEETYKADIQVPAVTNLENKTLQNSLNEKYLAENKQLYDSFMEEVDNLKKNGGGHAGVKSGYEVKTDNDQILSILRYNVSTVNTFATYKFDTIDKKNQVLLTLPILFKDESYVTAISEYIKAQMIEQMKTNPDEMYWLNYPGKKKDDLIPDDAQFQSIEKDQSFYINKDHKLVICFDKYEAGPGAMGLVEFVIPTDLIANSLVGNEYIQ
ncbi:MULTISPECIES: DUF3298 and DUF4163 domain-containing protein [Bacillales]|uniref:DUF3298 and DUF4163 domain-containing protein n=1 Tax=Bacillales TaxID=1385 RepID=UPI0003452F36|nr:MULTISPECIES: DUF3298 and DUF4163 domain-containing protein [Bacillales]KMZ44203.1 anti-sigma factor [Bacillus sp. FJAT-27238]